MSVGYGVEIWCTDSMHTGRLASGAAVVIQALYRRYITPRGTLRGISDDDEDLAYGFDVSAYVGAVGTTTAIAALPGLMRAEGLKDDRVLDLAFTITPTTDTAGLTTLLIEGSGTLHDESEDFAFTLAVTEVTTTLLGGAST
jgi:hypothetical protein